MGTVIKKTLVLICVLTMATFLLGTGPLHAKDKTINLLFGTFDVPISPFGAVLTGFGKEIETLTGGKVKMKYNWLMGKPGDIFGMLKKGVVDIAGDSPTFIPGLFPLTEIVELPFSIPTAEIGAKAMAEYLKKGYGDKTYDDVKVLWIHASDAHNILLVKKPVSKMDDYKGMKINVAGTKHSKIVKLMGGVPTYVLYPMQYNAMKKGIMDATLFSFPMLQQFKFYEVGKDVMEPAMSAGVIMCAMNKDKWNSLPADVQEIFEGLLDKYLFVSARAWDAAAAKGRKSFKNAGGQIHTFNQEELNKLNNALEPIWAEWVDEMEKKGLPGKKAVDDFYAILKGLGVENPAVGYKPGT